MKKKPTQTKSILTIPLEGVIISQLEKCKLLTGEKTSAGAIRHIINIYPRKVERIIDLELELSNAQDWIKLKQEAIDVILTSKKK